MFSPPVSSTPPMADNKVIGTMSTTASGILQLSYCAASTKKASNTHKGKTNNAVFPARICW
ncbi:hypothetical protein D3C78_1695410 [compost metagenome]